MKMIAQLRHKSKRNDNLAEENYFCKLTGLECRFFKKLSATIKFGIDFGGFWE